MSKDFSINLSLKKEKILVSLLCGIQIAHILDFVIIMPLGPVLMRAFEISPAQFGLLVSSYHLSAGIAGLFLGTIANKFERKKLLIGLFILFIIATLMCSFSQSYHAFLITRLIAGLFGGLLNSLVLTVVSEVIPFERRGKAMGSIISSFSIASVAGVPLGLLFADFYSWRATFVFIVLFSIIILLLLIFVFPQIAVSNKKNSFGKEMKILFDTLTNKEFIPAYALIGFISFSGFMLFPYLSTYAVNNMGIAESEVKYIYLFGGFFTIIASRVFGKLTDKYGALKVFIPAIIAGVPLIYAYTNFENIPLYQVLIIGTIFMALMSARIIPAMTLISEVASPEKRASFLSAQNSFRTLISALATYTAGSILVESNEGKLENFSFIGALSITMSLIAIVAAINLSKRIKK